MFVINGTLFRITQKVLNVISPKKSYSFSIINKVIKNQSHQSTMITKVPKYFKLPYKKHKPYQKELPKLS